MTSNDQFDGAPTPYHKLKKAFADRTAANCAAHLIPHLKPHFRILDIGCGPGSITLDLARLVPEGHVTGADISEDSIESARQHAQNQNVSNVEFLVANATDLTRFDSESFDVVHAHQVMLHLPKPVNVIKDIRRMLKPGGIFSTRDNALKTWIPESAAVAKGCTYAHRTRGNANLRRYINAKRVVAMYERLIRAKGADPTFGRVNHTAAHDAGFEWSKIETSSWGWEWSTEAEINNMVEGTKGLRAPLVKTGFGTDEDMDEVEAGYAEWGRMPESRFMATDGALLCWK